MTQFVLLDRRSLSHAALFASVAVFLAIVFTREFPILALVLTSLGVVSWSYVELRVYVRNLWLRRALKALPYFMPLIFVGIDLHGSLAGIATGVALGTMVLAIQWKRLRVALDRRLLRLMPRQSTTDAFTESMFFLLPCVAQEYFYRQAWLYTLVSHTHIWQWVAVVATSVMFSVEHLSGLGKHTAASIMNLSLWFAMGAVLSTAVLFTGQIWPAIICHAMANTPAAVQPHLRGKFVSNDQIS